jgi:hypothetical protein
MTTNVKLLGSFFLLLLSAAFVATPTDLGARIDWKQLVKERINLYGHRNWIVIADSAYPAQSQPGVETIVSNTGQLEVLKEVMSDLASSRHVRAIPHTDRELAFITDSDAPGVSDYRNQLFTLIPAAKNNTTLHEQMIHTLDEAGQTFRVLIIKTNMAIPYTTVFLQLDCAYWSNAQEQRLRTAMGQP